MPARKDFSGEDSYFGEGGYLDQQRNGGSSGGSTSTGGQCADCGGTGDCIHCNGGYYPRRDGTSALCGACHGQGNRKHPYRCHACKGRGYGGRRCKIPTYNETLERNRQGGQKQKGQRGSGWTPAGSQPPDVGVVAGTDHVVSFKTGGPNGDDTLIADGDYSDDPKGFNGTRRDRGHDHHGRWGSRGRGKYTGPDN